MALCPVCTKMPVHKIDPMVFTSATNFSLGLWTDSVTHFTANATQARALLSGAARNDPVQIAAKATQLLQAFLDVRIARSSLPAADPDKSVNPSRPDLFWDGTDLVGRAVLVQVVWSLTTYELRLSRTN